MLTIDYVIKHPVGLYASLANGLVSIANDIKAEAHIVYENKCVNMKSLMGIISLGVPYNGKIQIQITGDKKKEMKQKLEHFLKDEASFLY